ncbi:MULTISPECIES: RNB domain-containing ribonuclease [unclassified Variovorax]|uniref:RNB domain-containing ribonuclease n=1 Tax=unclassified Variovorax TaxID=663243 RepID=UPI00076DCA79|nr:MULTISPECIES: RNB domain-containing ribonuclease [unclassified Variovorax]KWT65077.1 3'-to-5' exoribonuclease RNase R [Variovorax sp. WDL1]PNG49051.1 Ribonuclease R [Variovorax sp. B2]PNG49436.1 Ribonuclease R [Variovorax sp. B4]VTV18944.1 Ribonuclease R [Variovorax sp. WDL1]
MHLFTIDAEHSRDLDDAIGIARNESGWTVRVAIANPSAHVAIGSTEDLEARKQGATIYRARQATRPMLPRAISEDQATLTAGVPRSAVVIDLDLDQAGQLSDTRLSLGDITVAQRLSYQDVPAIAADQGHPLHQSMVDAIAIARGFLKQRRARGALAFLDQQQLLLTDEEGRVQHFAAGEMVGHLLVQELMIAANSAVAEFAARSDVPFLYRCHEPRISAPRGLAAAESFEAWFAGGHASTAAAIERLNLITQKARYTSTLTGHYGLNVPAYAHITSPLRRYADLVDQRQLIALIQGAALPYSQDELTAIGNELFEVSEAITAEASDFYKAPVLAKAQAALEPHAQHALRALADNEVGQAVKAGLAGTFAPALVDELLRRMAAGTLADKISVRFIEGRAALPPVVAEGFISMIRAKPAAAVSFLHHARAINLVSDFEVQFEEFPSPTGPSFKATSTMRDAERGLTYRAVATEGKKKAAEQAAALLALCDLMGVARPAPSCVEDAAPSSPPPVAPTVTRAPQPEALQPPQTANSKGALLEFCQKQKLGTPTFTSTGTGPSNAPAFACTAELTVGEETFCASSASTPAKRQAEALAAAALLEQLISRQARGGQVEAPARAPAAAEAGPNTVTPAPTAVSERGRSIQLLQEYAQKARLPHPVYEFVEISKTPSSFECLVRLDLADGAFEARASGSSKQASKGAAATRALDQLAAAVAA